jgi:hypothetical protein
MALTLSEVQAITEDYWVNVTPVDIYFQDNVLLWKLMGKGGMEANLVQVNEIVDGGEKIRVVLEYANSNSGSYGNSTNINQSKKVILNAARFRWAGIYASNAIDLIDRVQCTGDAAKVDLAQSKTRNIQKTARDKMGTDVYSSAADNDSILGLGNLFNTTTSTAYGEIAEADMAQWAAESATASPTTMSLKLLQEMRRTPSIGQNKVDKPNLYITTDTIKDSFERTLHVQARYKDVDLANAGFENILFGNVPVVADDKQTSGYLDGLNLNYLKMKTHKDFKFTMPKWEYDKEKPDMWVANTRWIGQLVCLHRKAHVRKTGVTAAS